jgi:hypothetical protein
VLLNRTFKLIKTDQWHLFLLRELKTLEKGRGKEVKSRRQGVDRLFGVWGALWWLRLDGQEESHYKFYSTLNNIQHLSSDRTEKQCASIETVIGECYTGKQFLPR